MNNNQFTIKKNISFSGIGLHSGLPVEITLFPQDINSGIYFVLNKNKIKASWKNAIVSQLCTRIKNKNIYISTIEHLMSALNGLGITNLLISTSSSEIPILDGSAKEFYEKIFENGIENQQVKKKILKIKKKVLYKENEKNIEIKPSENNFLRINYSIDYKDEFIKKQKMIYEHNYGNYKNIYKARTFCLHKDLEKIFSMGLAKGGTLDNAIVVSGNKILNQGGLRYEDEFVKHKILDCIGDLYLSEFEIWGDLKTFGGGHELNLMLLKEIFKSKDNFEIL